MATRSRVAHTVRRMSDVFQTNWLMKDEIAAFLLDASPVTEQTLQMVADHVSSSCGRSSCILQTVPLQFVFGADQSFDTFLTVSLTYE